MDRQAATNVINEAWKVAATNAFNTVEATFKGTNNVEETYDTAVSDTETKRLKYVEEDTAYTTYIGDAAYTTPAAKAKVSDEASDVAEQKAVFDERALATIA